MFKFLRTFLVDYGCMLLNIMNDAIKNPCPSEATTVGVSK